jgi:hypothetical protein
MACALSESIFCWPRTRFFRARFPDEGVCVPAVDFVTLADLGVLLCLWATVFVAAGFVALASLVELVCALAAETQAQAATAQTAVNPALRISVETLNARPSLKK